KPEIGAPCPRVIEMVGTLRFAHPTSEATRTLSMPFQHFKLDIDGDGIALVTWDSPGRSMNVIDPKVVEELAALVEQVASDAAIKGAVVTSGKENFSAGANLTLLETLGRLFADLAKSKGPEAAATALFDESRKLSLLYRRLETSGKPWAAAINGTALG